MNPDPRRWPGLAVLLLAAFMDFVDVSIVLIAAPVIQADLGATYAGIQWMLAGYTLSFGLLLITGGRLGDLVGRKRVFLIGVAVFAVASAWCGLAGSIGVLVAARVVQGAGAGMMVPQVLATIQVSFPRQERPKAYGLYGAVAGLAFSAAPVISGLLLQLDLLGLSWRPVFLVNVPVGLAAFAGAAVLVRESRADVPPATDLAGVALSSAGILLLLYPLIQGNDLDWPLWAFAMMAAALPVLALFARYEARRERQGGLPLVPMSLFHHRSFSAGLLCALVVYSAVASFFFVLVIQLQAGHGLSPLRTGLITVAWPVGIGITSNLAVRLAGRLGRRLVSVGAVLVTACMLALIAAIQAAGRDVGAWQVMAALLVGGLGMGMIAPILVNIVMSAVPSRDAGAASGVTNTVSQIGAAAGLAVVGALFVVFLHGQAAPAVDEVTPQLRGDLATAGVPVAAQDELVAAFRRCALDRAEQQDPPSCQPQPAAQAADGASLAATPGVRDALVRAGEAARREVFDRAAARTLWYAVGAFALAFLLSFALPPRVRREEPQPAAVPA
jgi:EmrB/QacA subfamily drug resistance transporter